MLWEINFNFNDEEAWQYPFKKAISCKLTAFAFWVYLFLKDCPHQKARQWKG